MNEILSYIQELIKIFHIFEISGFQDIIINKKSPLDGFSKFYYTNTISKSFQSKKNALSLYQNIIFSQTELQTYKSFKQEFRKIEWFYGRLLAKIAIIECLSKLGIEIQEINQIEIISDSIEKPQFIINEKLNTSKNLSEIPVHFSISHKEGRIFAAATIERNVGIDIEKIQNLSKTLTKKIYNNSDRDEYISFLSSKKLSSAEDAINTGLWCVKEATAKALGLGLKKQFKNLLIQLFHHLMIRQ